MARRGWYLSLSNYVVCSCFERERPGERDVLAVQGASNLLSDRSREAVRDAISDAECDGSCELERTRRARLSSQLDVVSSASCDVVALRVWCVRRVFIVATIVVDERIPTLAVSLLTTATFTSPS